MAAVSRPGDRHRNALTYCGLVDDFAARHTGALTSVDELNRQLLLAVLFGDPLLVNDGYVVTHSAIRKAVIKPRSSPFRKLVEEGYVKILTRKGGDLGSLIEVMASQSITSAKLLNNDSKAKKHFAKWGTNLQRDFDRCFRPWPEYDTSSIFRKIAKDAHSRALAAHPDLEDELAAFDVAVSQTEGRRTEWEDTATRLVAEGKLSEPGRHTLMQVANDAYQYSWGCALFDGKASIRVQTRTPKYVMLDRPVGEVTSERREPVKVFAPDLEIAQKRVRTDWDRVAQMARPSHDVSLAKSQYLDTLDRYYTSDECDEKEMREAAKIYSKELSQHFKSKALPEIVFDSGFPVLAGIGAFVATAPAGPVVATAVGIAVGIAGTKADRLGGEHFLMKLVPGPRGGWITEGTPPPPSQDSASSFEVDPSRAASVLKGVPLFDSADR